MVIAAGRVAPAMRGRQHFQTNDRSRPTARRTSSSHARGSRASNKPCPRASLLHHAPNERNRVDARAFGQERFLEKWPSGRVCATVYRKVILVRRTISMTPRRTVAHLTRRFSPGSKLFLGTVVGWLTCWVVSYDSCDIAHAVLESVLRTSGAPDASSAPPGPPAGG